MRSRHSSVRRPKKQRRKVPRNEVVEKNTRRAGEQRRAQTDNCGRVSRARFTATPVRFRVLAHPAAQGETSRQARQHGGRTMSDAKRVKESLCERVEELAKYLFPNGKR